MEYELAEQLRDAGVPQADETELARGDRLGKRIFEDCKFPAIPEEAYAPALSELIEACGDAFNDLERYSSPGIGTYFIRHSTNDFTPVSGPTAEIAVARLWLALHANGDATA